MWKSVEIGAERDEHRCWRSTNVHRMRSRNEMTTALGDETRSSEDVWHEHQGAAHSRKQNVPPPAEMKRRPPEVPNMDAT